MAAELVKEKYHGAETVSRTEQAVLQRWKELLELLERHRASLARLAHLMALLREAEAVAHTLNEMKVCASFRPFVHKASLKLNGFSLQATAAIQIH